MIKHFKHKGLEQFFTKNNKKGLDARDIAKITRMLDLLDAATNPLDMNIPGWDFHELKSNKKGVFSVSVRRNWKMTFRFINGEIIDVNLEDYH